MRRSLAGLLGTLLFLAGLPSPAAPQTRVPLAAFAQMSGDSLLHVRLRIMNVGFFGIGDIPPVYFAVPDTLAESWQFTPYQPRPSYELSYPSDTTENLVARVSSTELAKLVQALAGVPSLAAGGIHGGIDVSVVAQFGTASIGFETVTSPATMDTVFKGVFDAIAGSTDAVCTLAATLPPDWLPDFGPPDAGGKIAIRFDDLRYDDPSMEYRCVVVAKNSTGTSLPGPIVVPISVPPGVFLADPDGITCLVRPRGTSYVLLAPGGLAPGEEASKALHLPGPGNIVWRGPKAWAVYAGKGLP